MYIHYLGSSNLLQITLCSSKQVTTKFMVVTSSNLNQFLCHWW